MLFLAFVILLLLSGLSAWPWSGAWAPANFVGVACFVLSLWGLLRLGDVL